MEFQSEQQKGYSSIFIFKCKMCKITSSYTSENEDDHQYLPINKAMVNGSIVIGM